MALLAGGSRASLDIKKRFREGLPGEASSPGSILSVTSRLIFLETPVTLISWAAATDWTDVDISPHTGEFISKGAYLALQLYFDGFKDAQYALEQMTGLLRKKGLSEAAVLPRITGSTCWDSHNDMAFSWRGACPGIVMCDEHEIFEAKLQTDSGTPQNIIFKIDLIGFFT